jgi:tRNA(Leu) C34 or U34 (ribose-2'-O)-methylase TrmL
MTRRAQAREARGYFAIGIYQPKVEGNVGTLMRSAFLYEAAFVFTIGHRYRRTAMDTPNTPRQIPLFHFDTLDEAVAGMPHDCPLVGVELDDRATALPRYQHRERAAYLLGAEDRGIPGPELERCIDVVQIPTPRPYSMNVAAAGSILLYDRAMKAARP